MEEKFVLAVSLYPELYQTETSLTQRQKSPLSPYKHCSWLSTFCYHSIKLATWLMSIKSPQTCSIPALPSIPPAFLTEKRQVSMRALNAALCGGLFLGSITDVLRKNGNYESCSLDINAGKDNKNNNYKKIKNKTPESHCNLP